MSRFLLASALTGALATLAFGQLTTTAQASAVTYDLTLQGIYGGLVGGTGSFTVDGPINSTGLETFTVSDGLDLSFTIDGNTFSSAPGGYASVTFNNGQLQSIGYAGTLDTWSFSLVTGLLNYIYVDLVDPAHSTFGNITAQLEATSQVSNAPLPAALPLFASGLGGIGMFGWWRRRKAKRNETAAPAAA
jgi:hypothetical protein